MTDLDRLFQEVAFDTEGCAVPLKHISQVLHVVERLGYRIVKADS